MPFVTFLLGARSKTIGHSDSKSTMSQTTITSRDVLWRILALEYCRQMESTLALH
jgi:hypothetical protein